MAGRQEYKERRLSVFATGSCRRNPSWWQALPWRRRRRRRSAAEKSVLRCGTIVRPCHLRNRTWACRGGVARVRARRGVGVGRRIYPFAGTSVQKGSTRSAHRSTPFPLVPHPTITFQSSILHSPSLSIFSRTLVVADTSSLVETFTLQITTLTHSLYRTYPEFLCENLPTLFHLLLSS